MCPDVLNLAGADMTAGDFEPIPSATYPCSVVRFETKFTKGGEEKKLPEGTPMFNVGLKVSEGQYENRWLWRSLIIAPAKVNGKAYEHKKMMDGMLARFFTALGFTEEEVTSGSFDTSDPETFIGRGCAVVVGQKMKYGCDPENPEYENVVKGFKPLTAITSGAASGGLT